MSDLANTEGIGEVYARKLRDAGILSTKSLLERGLTPEGRKEIAERTGIRESLILRWVRQISLSRIKGVGDEYAELLVAAGLSTVEKLVQQDPESLYKDLTELNQERGLVRRLPTQTQIESWIVQAQNLPVDVVMEKIPEREYLSRLRRMLSERFDYSGLQSLCFDLEVDFDQLPGSGKGAKAREIVAYLKRRERVADLIEELHRVRSDNPLEGIKMVRSPSPSVQSLPRILAARFDESELRTLCFELDIDYESLLGEGTADKARELVSDLGRKGCLNELIRLGKEVRPDILWNNVAEATSQPTAELDDLSPLETEDRHEEAEEVSVPGNEGLTEVFGTLLSHYRRFKPFLMEIKDTITRLSQVDSSDVQRIAASQIGLLTSYYTLVLDQAHRSFSWAIIAAGVGLIFFIASAGLLLRPPLQERRG